VNKKVAPKIFCHIVTHGEHVQVKIILIIAQTYSMFTPILVHLFGYVYESYHFY